MNKQSKETVEVYCNHNATKKVYIGSTQDVFKKRFYNHKCSFTHETYKNNTSLLKYIWEIKTKLSIDPILKWEIIKNAVNRRWVINFANCV